MIIVTHFRIIQQFQFNPETPNFCNFDKNKQEITMITRALRRHYCVYRHFGLKLVILDLLRYH